eukprot:scaffold141634_cov35-Tisochrysis_lutea.AAC.1
MSAALQSLLRSALSAGRHTRFASTLANTTTKQTSFSFFPTLTERAATAARHAAQRKRSAKPSRPIINFVVDQEQLNAMRLYARAGHCC